MVPNLTARRLSVIVVAVIMCAGLNSAYGQKSRGVQATSSVPGAGLNRIFTTGSSYGPLGRDRTIAADDQLLLFWSEPPSSVGNVKNGAYHFQVMNYLNTPSVPLDQRFTVEDSISGDSVTDAATGYRHPATGGSEYSTTLTGDMTGSGYDNAVSVWETYDSSAAVPGNNVFACALSMNSSTLKFQNTGITGEIAGPVASVTGNILDAHIRATMADLTGNGRKDLVVAWQDSSFIRLAVYGWSSSSASHLALLGSLSTAALVPPTASQYNYYSYFALSAGNFTDDTTSQITLAGFNRDGSLYIKLFKFENGGNIVAEGVASFSTLIQDPVSQMAMATGDFTSDNYNDCIALVLTDNGSVGLNNTALYIARPSQNLQSISVSSDSSARAFAYQPNSDQINASIGCGDLNGDGKDEIAMDVGDEVIVFEPEQNGEYLLPHQMSTVFVQGNTDVVDDEYSDSFLKVASVDQSRDADICVARDSYSDDGQGNIYQAIDVSVIAAIDTNLTLQVIGKKSFDPENITYSGSTAGLRRHDGFALGNFAGRSIMLGRPTMFRKTNVIQPLVILNAPPVEFDIFNNTPYDICDVFNGGQNAGDFAATYSLSTSNTDMMETDVTSSWGVGSSISDSAFAGGNNVVASLDTHYGKDFSRVSHSSYTTNVSVNVSAKQEDEIYAIVDNYDIWEYPVIDSGQVRGHVIVTVPGPPQGEWFDTESWTAYSFIPDHVVGNVLSYLTYDSLVQNPYMFQKIKGSLSDGFQLGTADYAWSLSESDFKSNSASTSQTFKLDVSAKLTAGKQFGKKLFGEAIGNFVTVGVKGDYSNSSLVSHTSTVTSTLGLTVHLGTINQALGEDQYTVTPYSYWGNNGALVIDYAVEPAVSQPGGTPTWWQQHYGSVPDPALALPYLYWPQEGFAVQDPEKIHQTKEILNVPNSVSPGDTITTTVRIHNYSLIPTDTTVQVKCYVGDPDSGGTIIKDVSGDSVFSTPSYIPPRGSQILSFKWIAPAQVNGNFIHGGDYVHVWADVDPNNTMKEIHTRNDLGWSILEVPGIVTGVNRHKEGPNAFTLGQNYPNPFNPTTVIDYTLPTNLHVDLKIYDVLGRVVETLVNRNEEIGKHSINFNGARLASGVYFYRLVAGSHIVTKKMLLLK